MDSVDLVDKTLSNLIITYKYHAIDLLLFKDVNFLAKMPSVGHWILLAE